MPIAALKVTTVTRNDGTCPRGGEGCGVCSSLKSDYLITEETDADSSKDTCRMLAAGALSGLWARRAPHRWDANRKTWVAGVLTVSGLPEHPGATDLRDRGPPPTSSPDAAAAQAVLPLDS